MLTASGQNTPTASSGQYSPLFLPFTYYGSVAHEALSLDGEPSEMNNALLDMYLRRPDLVQTTDAALRNELTTAAEQAEAPTPVLPPPAEEAAPIEPEAPKADVEVKKPNFWTFKGDGFLQFLQNYVSGNWYKGGESNYSMLSSLTLEANYNNKSKWKWDNKLEMKLGFQTSPSDSVNKFKANEDLIRLTSKVGLQATKHWYYTLQLLAYTQFTRGLKANDKRTYSDFMSPFNLNVGIGMDYKMEWFNKKLTGTVNISPLAVNYRYVDRTIFMNGDTQQWFPSRHGLEADRHSLVDLGSQFTVDFTWKMAENISWKSRMYGFTSYKRVEYEWENTFSFQFNKYISSKLFIHPRFDDNRQRDDHHGYWMFKEFLSIGFNYAF
ncbi:MAG: DUF3078 domain-containing protein [Prevotella sp.]|nr:DUF3078 domain-containing protein [Prevotella sp.]